MGANPPKMQSVRDRPPPNEAEIKTTPASGCGFLVFLFFIVAGLLPIALQKPKPKPTWAVELIRPDGEVHKRWEVKSKLSPKIAPRLGGQTELYTDKGSMGLVVSRYESTNLIAPVGWIWEIKSTAKVQR